MKLKNFYLLAAILLSIISKILQFKFKSVWGDIIILPSACYYILRKL